MTSSWQGHPAVTALATSVASGEFGLVHAVHGEYFPGGEGFCQVSIEDSGAASTLEPGSLGDVGIDALEVLRRVLGPARGPVHAVRTVTQSSGTQACTLTIHWGSGLLVTLLLGRGGPSVTATLHRYRILGSAGHAMIDLTAPSLQLYADGVRDLGFLPDPPRPGTGAPNGPVHDTAGLEDSARLIEAAQRSMTSGQPEALADRA